MPFDFLLAGELIRDFGVIRGAREKLLRQDSQAADKLADVLAELDKMVFALDEEIVRYLSLYFDSEQSIIDGRAVLLGMEVGQSRIRMNEARGHCHKIGNIYRKYLKRWFQNALEPADAAQLESLFTSLSCCDSRMLRTIDQVTAWLTLEAEEVLNMVDADNRVGANQRVRKARLDVKQQRRDFTAAMAELRELQAEFISTSNIV